jgi:hypothetical protein
MEMSFNHYEEFLLIFNRPKSVVESLLQIGSSNGPDEGEILRRTRHLNLVPSSCLSVDSIFFQGDLQSDLRKILSEIAKYSAHVLGSLPFAEKLLLFYRQKILMSLYNHTEVVQLLTDMGFIEDKVIRALKIHNRDYSVALDWLIENEETTRVSEENLEKAEGTFDDMTQSVYARLSKTVFPSSSFFPKHEEIVSVAYLRFSQVLES